MKSRHQIQITFALALGLNLSGPTHADPVSIAIAAGAAHKALTKKSKHMCEKGIIGELAKTCFKQWREATKLYKTQKKQLRKDLQSMPERREKVLPIVKTLHQVFKRVNIYYPLRQQSIQAKMEKSLKIHEARGASEKKLAKIRKKYQQQEDQLEKKRKRWDKKHQEKSEELNEINPELAIYAINAVQEQKEKDAEEQAQRQADADAYNQQLQTVTAGLEGHPYGPYSGDSDVAPVDGDGQSDAAN